MIVKNYPLTVILPLAVLIWGASLYVLQISMSWEQLKPYSATLFILTACLAAFEKLLWRWVPFGLVKTPDLHGTWRAELKSTYMDDELPESSSPIKAFVCIRQTFSRISIRLMTSESSSVLISSNIIRREDGAFEVAGIYQSEPILHLRGKISEIHYGAFKLRVIGNPVKSLEGHYWTDRITKGTIAYRNRVKKVADSFREASELFQGKSK